MSAPNPVLYETGTSTPLAVWDFGTLGPSETSATHAFDLKNSGASVETMTETMIGVLISTDAGVTFDLESEAAIGRWVQVRATGQSGTGIEAQTTAWTPVGLGARLLLKQIPADCRRVLEARVVTPAGFSSFSGQVKFIVYWLESSVALSQGIYESGGQGVMGGTADAGYTELIQGGTLAQTGTPDNNLQLTDVTVVKCSGVPFVLYPQALAIAASASGKARWCTITVDATGALNSTESAEVTTPAATTLRPAVPAGEAFLGWVHRDDGTIATADIYQTSTLYAPFGFKVVSGLSATIGPGRALADNSLIFRERNTSITLANNVENIVNMLSDGTVEVVDAGDPSSSNRPCPLWSVTTAASAVTVTRDLREFLGPRNHTFSAHFPGNVATSANPVYWTAPLGRSLVVRVPKGGAISVAAIGARAAGVVRIPLEYWDGAAWTSIYSSTSQEPQLAYNATVLAVGGFLPDLVSFAAGTRFRWRIAEIPTGGATDPTDAFVTMDFEEYGP